MICQVSKQVRYNNGQSVGEIMMTNLEAIYVERRAQQVLWVLTPEHLRAVDEAFRPVQAEAAHVSEDEINAAIDDAFAEVRRERKNPSPQI